MRSLHCLAFVFLAAACGSAAAPGAGRPLPGADPVPDKTTFQVDWAPNAHVVSNASALLTSKEPEQNGQVTYHFKSDPALTALAPGDVAVLAGIAYRKVVSVTESNGEVVLVGEHTKLTEAIAKGHLGWDSAVDFTDPQKVRSMSVGIGDGVGVQTDPGSLSWSGHAGEFDVSITFTPNGGRLNLNVTASKSIAGQRRISLVGDGYIERYRSQGDWSWDGSDLQFHAGTTQFHGDLHVKFAAFNAGASQDLLDIPLSLSYPVAVGPVPLIVSLKAKINVTAELDVTQSSSEAEIRMQFDTNQGVDIGTAATPVGQLANPVLEVIGGGSAAGIAAGLTGCVEFPRTEVGFMGEAVSVGLTQNNCASSVFTFEPACNEASASIVGKALYQASFLGVSLASGDVELYNRHVRRGTNDPRCMPH